MEYGVYLSMEYGVWSIEYSMEYGVWSKYEQNSKLGMAAVVGCGCVKTSGLGLGLRAYTAYSPPTSVASQQVICILCGLCVVSCLKLGFAVWRL